MTSQTTEPTYWSSSVSEVRGGKVLIRGYDLEEVIGGLDFTMATYLLVRGELPSPGQVRVLNAVLNAVLDFALEKPGTVAARFAVSANPQMAVGMAAACMSVGQHTLATEDTSRYVLDVNRRFTESGTDLRTFADAEVQRLRSARQRIPGLGHPVFKKVDPRAAVLRDIAVQEGCWPTAGDVYLAIHEAFTALPGKADIVVNDVGMMAVVLVGLGFSPEEGTGMAILSTLPGVVAHVSEELAARKPIRVVSPDQVTYDVVDRNLARDKQAAGWPSPGARLAEGGGELR